MNDAEIRRAILDIYADCTGGKNPESITVRAGDTDFVYNSAEDLGNSSDDFVQTAANDKAAAEKKAQEATFDARFEKLLQSETFIKSAVSAALAGHFNPAKTPQQGREFLDGALERFGAVDTDLADFIQDKIQSTNSNAGNLRYQQEIGNAVDKYLKDNFSIVAKYPISESAAAIAKHATEAMFGTGQSAEKDRVKALIARTKGTPNASPTVLALMVNTGLRGADLKAIPDLQRAWSGTDATKSNAERFKTLNTAQQNLARKVAAYAQLSGKDDFDKAVDAMLLIDEAMKLDANDLSPSDQTQPTAPVMSEEEQLVFEAYAGAGQTI
jgi:hypothetical protein